LAQIIILILVIALVGFVFKLALIALAILSLASLIWRPKETMGTFLFLFILGMIGTYPWIALGTAVFMAIAAYFMRNKSEKSAPKQVEPEAPPDPPLPIEHQLADDAN
jgi:predicted membrane protein